MSCLNAEVIIFVFHATTNYNEIFISSKWFSQMREGASFTTSVRRAFLNLGKIIFLDDFK